MQFIDLKKQYALHKEAIDGAIHEVLDDGRYINGPKVSELEEVLAEYVGVRHCIGYSSGTDTLLAALMALGIGPGDEVITVPFTFISTAEVIALVGATPRFIDIDPATYNMDLDQLEAAITPRTRAIMPVSLFGQMADYEVVCSIASKHGISVIEDGAQSFGAARNGRRSCGVTDIGSTSFFPAKPFGCYGDGGALFLNDDTLADKIRAIRNHGGLKKYYHDYVGINGRLDTIQAAILLAKFPHFQGEVEARSRIGARYSELLKELCTVPVVEDGNLHVYAQYTIRLENRDLVAKELYEKGIPTAVYYPKCLHEQPAFAHLGYDRGSFPVSERAADEVLSLPMHPWLTVEEQDEVVEAVRLALSSELVGI